MFGYSYVENIKHDIKITGYGEVITYFSPLLSRSSLPSHDPCGLINDISNN